MLLANAIAAYITVHGFQYTVEIVTVPQADAPAALLKGDIDLMLVFDRESGKGWYDEQIYAGNIFDLGSLYTDSPDLRIVGATSLRQRAADLVAFYGKVKPGDEAFDSQAAAISMSRTGTNALVAALTFFKNNSALWPEWMPAEVSGRVNTAIADKKTSLRTRDCIPGENNYCR